MERSDFRFAALRSAVVQRAERIRFRDQKITAPHTDGVKGRLFPPEQWWKSSTVLDQRPVKLCNVIETHEHKGDFKGYVTLTYLFVEGGNAGRFMPMKRLLSA